jgi:hypothetical protein
MLQIPEGLHLWRWTIASCRILLASRKSDTEYYPEATDQAAPNLQDMRAVGYARYSVYMSAVPAPPVITRMET